MTEITWTPLMVEARLAEAADVLYRLPKVRVLGYVSSWPEHLREQGDGGGDDQPTLRRPPPSAAAITRMDASLEWLRHLEPEDCKIVWMRANGEPWKIICWKMGMTRSSAHRHWIYGLCVIAWTLNGKRIPKHLSMQDLIARTKAEEEREDRPRTREGEAARPVMR